LEATEDWMDLSYNTNGLSKGGYTTGYGGVLQGENGECICGFSKGLGSCDSYVAELWGAFEGLKLARARGFHRVELHVDF
jgi:ribonuclease HI